MKNLNNALEDLRKNNDSSNRVIKTSLDNLNKAWGKVASKCTMHPKMKKKMKITKNNTNDKSKQEKERVKSKMLILR